MDLYRGTIAFDEPLQVRRSRLPAKPGRRPYRRFKAGKRNDPEYNLARKQAWREKNREKFNAYHREYKRRRQRKSD